MQLKIDTTQSKKVRVEICDNLSKIKDSLFITRKSGSQSLLPAIAKILKKNKKTLSDIKAVEVNTGPGSFTGTRVGVSVANALGFALNIPVNGSLASLRSGPSATGKKGKIAMPIYEESKFD